MSVSLDEAGKYNPYGQGTDGKQRAVARGRRDRFTLSETASWRTFVDAKTNANLPRPRRTQHPLGRCERSRRIFAQTAGIPGGRGRT